MLPHQPPLAEQDSLKFAQRAGLIENKIDIAAKTLLDRAGHIAPRANDNAGQDRPLNEMTRAELHALLARLESELASCAKPVAGNEGASDAELLD